MTSANPEGDWRGQHGTTLLECLVASAIAVALAGGFCSALLGAQSSYRGQTGRLALSQQAQFALDFLVDELRMAVWADRGLDCPNPGVQLAEARVSFLANLYDRNAHLSQAASAAQSRLVFAPRVFEPNDAVEIVDVRDPADPSDDVAECRRVIEAGAGGVTVDRPLTRSYPAGSQVHALNAVSYALDERNGRLMRSQDGTSQRVAQEIESFSLAWSDRTLTIRIGMKRRQPNNAPVRAERWITFEDIP